MTIQSEEREITPAQAARYLEGNSHNRRINNSRVDRYAKAMKIRAWQLNGQTISFDQAGRLLDGQHRLLACVKAGVAFRCLIVTGLPSEAFATIDVGANRNGGDALSVEGVANSKHVATAARTALTLLRNSFFTSGEVVENTELLTFVHNNPRIINCATRLAGVKTRSAVPMGAGLTAGLYYVISRSNPDLADEFIAKFISGEALTQGNPILALRTRLFSAKISKNKLHPREQAALFLRAWAFYVRGETVTQLKGSIRGLDGRQSWPTVA